MRGEGGSMRGFKIFWYAWYAKYANYEAGGGEVCEVRGGGLYA